MALQLRPYQENIIAEARALMEKGHRHILICSPTGSGKTALTANMLASAAGKKMRSFFNVHRRELIKQSVLAFEKAGVSYGIVASGFPDNPNPYVQVASIQSLARRYQKYKSPQLVIWDECPHIAATSWSKMFHAYPNAFHIGLTATPERLDGKGLRDYFKVMVKGPSVSWLIENNYLADYRLYAPSTISMAGVQTQMGDFKRSQTADLVDKPTITGSAVTEYKKVASGKRAVVFCVSIKHSEHVVAEFNAAGISARHVDGETSSFTRDQTIEDFAAGRIKVLSNVDLFGEGFDLPAIEVAILLRPTKSLALYLQQVGRVLRPSPGKSHAIILDHVGNVERHGLPDQEHQWTLDGRAKRMSANGESNTSVKICDNCFAAQLPGRDACKFCQHTFEKSPRKIEEVGGELTEIDLKVLRFRKNVERMSTRSLEDLTELAVSRGYKFPRRWAKHVFQARQRKKIGGR